MKKAFTLIELVIVIAIIGIMAVLAMPLFDKFSAQAELNDKSEEMKLIIEQAYLQTISPVQGDNAARIVLSSGVSGPVMVLERGSCVRSADSVCTDSDFIQNSSENIPFNTTAKHNFSFVNLTNSPTAINFFTPLSSKDIYFDDGSGHLITGANKITITLRRVNTQKDKKIIVNRYPFYVTVQDDE